MTFRELSKSAILATIIGAGALTAGCGQKAEDKPVAAAPAKSVEDRVKEIQNSTDIPQQAKADAIAKVRSEAGASSGQ